MAVDLEAIFGDDLVDILESLDQELTPALEEMITSVVESMTYDVEVFNARIAQLETSMLGSGTTLNAIDAVIDADLKTFGRITGELNNSVKNSISQSMMYASTMGSLDILREFSENMRWVTVSGRVCADCDRRSGQIETFHTWEKLGLPGSGWSVCRGYCYCVLDSTGTFPDKMSLEEISEYKGR